MKRAENYCDLPHVCLGWRFKSKHTSCAFLSARYLYKVSPGYRVRYSGYVSSRSPDAVLVNGVVYWYIMSGTSETDKRTRSLPRFYRYLFEESIYYRVKQLA